MRRSVRLLLRPSLLFVLLMSTAQMRADEPYRRAQLDANAREHWSFQSVVRPEVPRLADDGWSRNPIDAFVLQRLRQAGLKPAAPATRTTLLRRVYLDLIGLPPTVEEVDAFLADTSPVAFEGVVEQSARPAAVWRALGAPLVGRRALCRDQRL